MLEYKWAVLVFLEVLAWAATFFLFYARYRSQSRRLFRFALILTVGTGIIPQVFLGILNYNSTKEIDLFALVILILLIYGFTLGRKHVQRLDQWAQKKFSRSPMP